MSAAPRRVPGLVSVLTRKANGCDVCFSTYASRAEAERVVAQLLAVGCAARIERALASDLPGVTRVA